MSAPKPAFPVVSGRVIDTGLTARAYAAIHLLQPISGEKWLDDAINAARRERMALAAMQGILADTTCDLMPEGAARCAVGDADALLARLKEGA